MFKNHVGQTNRVSGLNLAYELPVDFYLTVLVSLSNCMYSFRIYNTFLWFKKQNYIKTRIKNSNWNVSNFWHIYTTPPLCSQLHKVYIFQITQAARELNLYLFYLLLLQEKELQFCLFTVLKAQFWSLNNCSHVRAGADGHEFLLLNDSLDNFAYNISFLFLISYSFRYMNWS